MPAGGFAMTKWYLDCVTGSGDAAILYCADLRWRGVHARMASLLQQAQAAPARTRTSLGKFTLTAAGGEIAVDHPRWKLNGCWSRAAPPFHSTLYESDGGAVTWDCLQPASRVSLRIGERSLDGLGYAECLTLTLPPWQLPMRDLVWGRFVSSRHALTWIRWRGPREISLALCDGQPSELRSATESQIEAGEVTLRIEPGAVLRDGRLGDTVLPGARVLARLFPPTLFNVIETKWKSRATLRIAGEECPGWAIHELVRFPEVN